MLPQGRKTRFANFPAANHLFAQRIDSQQDMRILLLLLLVNYQPSMVSATRMLRDYPDAWDPAQDKLGEAVSELAEHYGIAARVDAHYRRCYTPTH